MARILTGPLTRALVVENPHNRLDPLLLERGFKQVVRLSQAPEAEELLAELQAHRSQVLFKRSRVPVTRQVIEGAPDLLAIQLCCIGDDSIDKQACADHGVLVFNDPISNGRSVVELAIGHLISLSRGIHISNSQTHKGDWQKHNRGRFEVYGKRLGIVGLGNIGRGVAKVAQALGMEVRFHDNRRVAQEVGQEMGWTSSDTLQALFADSDMVTLHASAVDFRGGSNAGLVTRELLMSLGSNRPENAPRVFLNLSRGFLHDPADLISAVEAKVIRAAAVDVYPKEPRSSGPGWDNPYGAYAQIVCTPHIGAATQEAQPRIAQRVAETTLAFSREGSIRDCVLAPRTQVSMSDDLRPGRAVLVVAHGTTRGTKRALDQAIFETGADNLRSEHHDLERWSMALDINLLDQPLPASALALIAQRCAELSEDPDAVRSIRQVVWE